MPDLVHDIALVRQRRNPARINYRSYEIVQGEDVQLAVTVWNKDTDAQPVDVSGTALFMSLFRQNDCGGYAGGWGYDYGHVYPAGRFAVAQVAGVPAGDRGRVDINLTRDVTAGLSGRYWFLLYAVARPAVALGDFSSADFSASDFLVSDAPAISVATFSSSDFSANDFLVNAAPATPVTTVLGQGILDVIGCPWGRPALLSGTLDGLAAAVLVAPSGALLGEDGVPLLGDDYMFLLPPDAFLVTPSSVAAFSVAASPVTPAVVLPIAASPATATSYAETIMGDGIKNSFVITHNLGTYDVIVVLRNPLDANAEVPMTDNLAPTPNTVEIVMTSPFTKDAALRVIVFRR